MIFGKGDLNMLNYLDVQSWLEVVICTLLIHTLFPKMLQPATK